MSAQSSELLSVIVPCYNEEEGLLAAIERLTAVLGGANIPYELIFVNDGSRDNTMAIIEKASKKDSRVRGISFSRNFGKEAAMQAGLAYASGAWRLSLIAICSIRQRSSLKCMSFGCVAMTL